MATDQEKEPAVATIGRDLVSGLVVFLVALPLCLGIAEASDAEAIAGLLSGIVGGLLVAAISGSQTSVSGPAAALTAVVAAQIANFGSFEVFLVALPIAGVIQIGFGMIKAGTLVEYFPTSVIKGLLAAIGLILILKQIPHLFGHDDDPEGEMSLVQPDDENTFSELLKTAQDLFDGLHYGPMLVGFFSLAFLIAWNRISVLKSSRMPPALLIVILGVGATQIELLSIEASHRVNVPVVDGIAGISEILVTPDWSALGDWKIYVAGLTIALVASLASLLNLEAVDRIDPMQRHSPPNRELIAQGFGNIVSGLIGGLPVTSVIIRSSVNINAGARTKLSAIFHGVLLVMCVLTIPQVLNQIPKSTLAAILLMTGFKLLDPPQFTQMWRIGLKQFLPFVMTIGAIVMTDLLIGILIGLVFSFAFILIATWNVPARVFRERRMGADVTRIELANQISFLNKAALLRILNGIPEGGHVLFDARMTTYIDPDIEDLIEKFEEDDATVRGMTVSKVGFSGLSKLDDQLEFLEHVDSRTQQEITPEQALLLLKQGNARFLQGYQISRDLRVQQHSTADGQFPIAVILGCIDSRAPSELIFDCGLGDIVSVRIAGNVVKEKVLGSIEYGCVVAGSKLVVVMGHTRCGAVTSALEGHLARQNALEATGCEHIDTVLDEIRKSIEDSDVNVDADDSSLVQKAADEIAVRNVRNSVEVIRRRSRSLRQLEESGQIRIVGAMYDVQTGRVDIMDSI